MKTRVSDKLLLGTRIRTIVAGDESQSSVVGGKLIALVCDLDLKASERAEIEPSYLGTVAVAERNELLSVEGL